MEINEENQLLNACYQNQNYKIVQGLNEKGFSYIFCSSNGLYFPNNEENLFSTIIKNDRYEWERTGLQLLSVAKKIIYIRDVRKNWYVTGISSKIGSIDELIDWLRLETENESVRVIGNSAGGYLSLLLGVALNADAVYSFGGQIDLRSVGDAIETSYFLNQNKDDEVRNKWFNLREYLQTKTSSFFYFYAAHNSSDIEQYQLISNNKQVFCFAMNSSVHGAPLEKKCYAPLFQMNVADLIDISKKHQQEELSSEDLYQILSAFEVCKENLPNYISKVLKSEKKEKNYITKKDLLEFVKRRFGKSKK